MSDSASVLVLGVHSFAAPHCRTGIQHIAAGLAEAGMEVDYVSVPSSPFDVLGAERRQRLQRVFGSLGGRPAVSPGDRLREYAFASPVPLHRLFVPGRAVLRAATALSRSWFRRRTYDVCIHDVGPCMAYLPLVRAGRHVLRLNDPPRGFSDLPPVLADMLEERLAGGFYDQVWAVSKPLVRYARGFAPDVQVRLLPNGFEARLFAEVREPDRAAARGRAVYLGGNVPWLDVDLVLEAARLLPQWEFHFVGGGFGRIRGPGNVRFLPPVPHSEIEGCLRAYEVGLLPYRETDGRMAYVHRPLKFYEYYAAGLGVACADVGGLREGLGEMASFGSGPEEFAAAVGRSVEAAGAVTRAQRREFMAANDWAARLEAIRAALSELGVGC